VILTMNISRFRLPRVMYFLAIQLALLNYSAYSENKLPAEVEKQLQMQADFLQKFWAEYDGNISKEPGVNQKIRFVSDSGRFFFREEARIQSTQESVITERSFDGHIYYQGTPSLRTSMVLRMLGENPDDPKAKTTWIKARLLDSIGIQIPTSARRCLDDKIEPKVLFLNRIGRLESITEDADGCILKYDVPKYDYQPARSIQLALSKKFNFAIVQWSETSKIGTSIREIKCSDFSLVDNSRFYMPKRVLCTVHVADYYTENPAKSSQWTYGFSSIGAGTDTSGVKFAQNGPVGSIVAERSSEEAKKSPNGMLSYQVPASYDTLAMMGMALYNRRLFLLGTCLFIGVLMWFMRKQVGAK